jgi:hypothetical protein
MTKAETPESTNELSDDQVFVEAVKQSRWWHKVFLLIGLLTLIPSAVVVILTVIPATRAPMLEPTSDSNTSAFLLALPMGAIGVLLLGNYFYSRRDMARRIENARANPDSPDMHYLRRWWSRPGSAAFFDAMKMMLPIFGIVIGFMVVIVGASIFVLHFWRDRPWIGLFIFFGVFYGLLLVIPRLRRRR